MDKSHEIEACKVHFEKVTTLHKKTIHKWFEEDHVKEFFYGDGAKKHIEKSRSVLPRY